MMRVLSLLLLSCLTRTTDAFVPSPSHHNSAAQHQRIVQNKNQGVPRRLLLAVASTSTEDDKSSEVKVEKKPVAKTEVKASNGTTAPKAADATPKTAATSAPKKPKDTADATIKSAPAAKSIPAAKSTPAAETEKPKAATPATKPKKKEKEKASSSNTITPSVTKTATVSNMGIGGKDGLVYDVNKLKTNLVQRAVADYKKQLWDLLGTPDASQEAIEEKLASLCQANPVYTTTDSNLLEGKWTTVFSSVKPAQVLLDDDRFGMGYEKTTSATQKASIDYVVGKTAGGMRQFILENLDLSQDPFVVDKQGNNPLFGHVNYYRVASLTRQSLDLVLFRKTWKVFGYPLWVRRYRTVMSSQLQQTTMQVQILYLDSDLCISVNHPMGGGSNDKDNQQPFTVYTKSPAWVARTETMKRHLRQVRSRFGRIRGKLSKSKRALEDAEALAARNAVLNDKTMWLEYEKGESKLRVVKLGDVGEEDDELAWEGETDPFVHLSPNDRQRVIKKMDLGEIKNVGKEKTDEVKRLSKKTGKKLNLKRQMKFEKPSQDD